MNTKPLSKKEYPSPYNFDPESIIRKIVLKDEAYFETVVDLQGVAGKPIYQPCEIIF